MPAHLDLLCHQPENGVQVSSWELVGVTCGAAVSIRDAMWSGCGSCGVRYSDRRHRPLFLSNESVAGDKLSRSRSKSRLSTIDLDLPVHVLHVRVVAT